MSHRDNLLAPKSGKGGDEGKEKVLTQTRQLAEGRGWKDLVLENDLAEMIPIFSVAVAGITICTTFSLFFASRQTTKKVCLESNMHGCDTINDWQLMPTLSFTFVPWPGYIVSCVGMLAAAALLWVSCELEHRILQTQLNRMNLPPTQRITGICCCCCSVHTLTATSGFLGHMVCLCLVVCIICQLRFSLVVHSTAAFLLFTGGLLMMLTQQQIQATLLRLGTERNRAGVSRSWSEKAEIAMNFKRRALLGYLICFIAYGVAVSASRNVVEPYSAALEYAVVVALAIGILSYAKDIKVHKEFFGGDGTRTMVVNDIGNNFSDEEDNLSDGTWG
mmetsp:Transcript_10849/g.26559  ORF Transcript_10849/g.26559 Transcript_10849/m.26559 type:complete len:333 (+) Transcript_10849:181-1179(+)